MRGPSSSRGFGRGLVQRFVTTRRNAGRYSERLVPVGNTTSLGDEMDARFRQVRAVLCCSWTWLLLL